MEETTLEFRRKYRNAISEATQISQDSAEIKNWLVSNRGLRTAKECLRHLDKACQHGMRHKKISENLFYGMASEIKIERQKKINIDSDEDEDARSFSVEEMNAIIAAFETAKRRHLAPIVKFLFWTGCRTGEAIALKWRDVKWEKELICFRRTYNDRLHLFKPTKTGVIRWFTMPKNGLIWNIIKLVDTDGCVNNEIVFKSKMGEIMNGRNLSKIWKGSQHNSSVIPQLIEQGKVKEYLKLYATRHTFIFQQVNICKIPITTVAQWVGNKAIVSNNNYLDRDKISIPGNSETINQLPVNGLPNQLIDTLINLKPEQAEQLKAILSVVI